MKARKGEELLAHPEAAFRHSPWLPSPHFQSIWASYTRRRPLVTYRREIIATPDGDELVLDHVDGVPGAPRAILLHGLEGSSYASYIQGMASRILSLGYRITAVNFRSCARAPENHEIMMPNRMLRLYHSGETTDFGHVVDVLHEREPTVPFVAAGVSLGGNVLLKWLGSSPRATRLSAAVTISVPFDLGAGAHNLKRGLGRVYVARFLLTLRPKAEELRRRFPDAARLIDPERLRLARTFHEFDDVVTAPIHGFAGVEDYYARSSSIEFLSKVPVPTLCINAIDDPFLGPGVLDRVHRCRSDQVQLLTPPGGGHAGFVGGAPWRPVYWAEDWVPRWFAAHLP
jgi:predicted alpha/beta-fold hydrolase